MKDIIASHASLGAITEPAASQLQIRDWKQGRGNDNRGDFGNDGRRRASYFEFDRP